MNYERRHLDRKWTELRRPAQYVLRINVWCTSSVAQQTFRVFTNLVRFIYEILFFTQITDKNQPVLLGILENSRVSSSSRLILWHLLRYLNRYLVSSTWNDLFKTRIIRSESLIHLWLECLNLEQFEIKLDNYSKMLKKNQMN